MVAPPSTLKLWPVIYDDLSIARKATAAAISSLCAIRCQQCHPHQGHLYGYCRHGKSDRAYQIVLKSEISHAKIEGAEWQGAQETNGYRVEK